LQTLQIVSVLIFNALELTRSEQFSEESNSALIAQLDLLQTLLRLHAYSSLAQIIPEEELLMMFAEVTIADQDNNLLPLVKVLVDVFHAQLSLQAKLTSEDAISKLVVLIKSSCPTEDAVIAPNTKFQAHKRDPACSQHVHPKTSLLRKVHANHAKEEKFQIETEEHVFYQHVLKVVSSMIMEAVLDALLVKN